MGAAASSGGISRQSVYQETTTTRDVLNTGFNLMIKELNFSDFYKLSNPRECAKYVLFLANKIDESFYKLDLVPSFKDGGRIFFRPVKQLQEPKEDEKTERQSLCVFLSYFFIRFFQIFGAVGMTLHDDIAVVSKSGILGEMGQQGNYVGPSRSLGTPGFEGQKGISPYREPITTHTYYGSTDWRRPRIRNYNNTRRLFGGGAATTAAGVSLPKNFQFLSRYVLPGQQAAGRLSIGYKLHSGNGSGVALYFKPPGTSIFGSQAVGFLYAPFKGHPNNLFELQITGLGNNKIRLTGIAFRRPSGDTRNKDLNQDQVQRLMKGVLEFQFTPQGPNDFAISVEGKPETPYIFLRDLINYLMDQVNFGLRQERGLRPSARYDDSNRDRYRSPFESSSDKYRSPFESGTNYFRSSARESDRYRTADSSFYEADRAAPAALKLDMTLAALGKIKPVPSCIGRAIQLLKTRPLDIETGLTESDICSSKFLVGEDNRLGATRPGESLDHIPGLMGLLQTFYEFVQYKNPTILMDLKNTIEPYKQFMMNLAERYELSFDADDAEKQKVEQETFHKIEKTVNPDAIKRMTKLQLEMKDRRMEKICQELKEKDGKVVVEGAVAADVRESVNALLRTQLLHAANCAKILNQLFLIHGTGPGMAIEIHPNLFKKGMPELDRINDAARALLVTYYETCEKQYMEGVQKIIVAKQARNATRKQRNEIIQPENEDVDIMPPIAPVAAGTAGVAGPAKPLALGTATATAIPAKAPVIGTAGTAGIAAPPPGILKKPTGPPAAPVRAVRI